MIAQRLGRRYAEALGSLAAERGRLKEVRGELSALREALADGGPLLAYLKDRRPTPQQKRKTLEDLMGPDCTSETLNFLRLVVHKQREGHLPAIIDAFLAYADEVEGIMEVKVYAAQPLADASEALLKERLERALGSQVRLRVEVDPALLAGVVVRVGDLRIDGSAARRLQRLEERLRQASLN